MKIRPLRDRLLIRRLEEDAKSAGGIIIPDSASKKPSKGEVLAVGPGLVLDSGKLQPMDVKVGDQVLFGDYSGSAVKFDGEELLILRESEIFGIISQN